MALASPVSLAVFSDQDTRKHLPLFPWEPGLVG